jgi:hypothetical protein
LVNPVPVCPTPSKGFESGFLYDVRGNYKST